MPNDVLDVRTLRATWRYRILRDRFILQNPLCAECDRQGRVTLSKELDHIIPAHERADLFWDQENWQALCEPCHHRKTSLENRQTDPERDKWDALIERLSTPG